MSDVSGISGPGRLTSQLKVSLESVQKQPETEAAANMDSVKEFENQMMQVQHAFELADQIHASIQAALNDLSPNT